MLRIRTNNELPTLESFVNDFFGFTPSFINDRLNENYSAFNTIENEDNYELSVALPGYKKDDISINIDNDVLTISSELNEENEQKGKNYITKQIKKCSFTKRFVLSDDIDKDKINAKMEDGILHIKLDKIKKIEVNNTKKISIE